MLSNRDVYLDMIDGLAYGEDSRNGYFEDQRFLHPDLAFDVVQASEGRWLIQEVDLQLVMAAR